MRGNILSLIAAAAFGIVWTEVDAQDAVRFDRPVFTTDATALCHRQDQVAALRRALDDNDRAAINRLVGESCKLVGPNIRLNVVTMPGSFDPDVEVRVANAPGHDRSVPRSNVWTLKALVRN